MGKAAWEEEKTQPPPGQPASRARAIFDASEEVKPFNPSDFDFAMVEDDLDMSPLATPADVNDPESLPSSTANRKRTFGMTTGQLGVVAALVILLIVVIAVFAYLVLTSFPALP